MTDENTGCEECENAYEEGKEMGHDAGRDSGYEDGYDDGYSEGLRDGREAAKEDDQTQRDEAARVSAKAALPITMDTCVARLEKKFVEDPDLEGSVGADLARERVAHARYLLSIDPIGTSHETTRQVVMALSDALEIALDHVPFQK